MSADEPLFSPNGLSSTVGGRQDLHESEELNHNGSHKVNNVLGQIMLAGRMGQPTHHRRDRAGQHGVRTATL